MIINLNFLVTSEYSCGQPPEYGGKGIGQGLPWEMWWGTVWGSACVMGIDDREMALKPVEGHLSDMSLQMIMLMKTFYLVTWKEHIWVISAEISKLKAWRPECK